MFLAGVAGFEPTNARIKILCLTTWRHPYMIRTFLLKILAGVVGFEPTQCWNQNPMPYHLATPHHNLNQKFNLGWSKGLEPLTSRATIWRSANWTTTTIKLVVLPEGFEPSTSALEGHCSIQLSYGSAVEQVKGIGPSRPAWKAGVLPLNYTCVLLTTKVYHKRSVLSRNLTKFK